MGTRRSRNRRLGVAAVLTLVCAALTAPGVAAQEDVTTTTFNPASRFGTEPVDIIVESRTDYPEEDLPSPLYIPLRARLVNPETGEPVPESYTVQARVDVPGQDSEEKYGFAYPYGDTEAAQPGHYNGIVIVPAGGTWRIVVNAFNHDDAEDNEVPKVLGRGEITVEAEGPALQSTLGETDEDVVGNRDPSANLVNVALLFLHAGIAGIWYVLAAGIILVALPARRKILSMGTSQMLDRNVGKLGNGLLWMTGILWFSGIINLQRVVAFEPPMSTEQAERLWVLPYAKPYIFALYSKIGVYALMTIGAFALVREAKRRAAMFERDRFRADREAQATVAEGAASPNRPDASAPNRAPSGGTATLARRQAARQARARPAVKAVPAGRLSGAARFGVLSVAIGAPVIIFCVTVLKYVHISSEELLRFQ